MSARDIRGQVAIVGIGHTEQGQLPGRSPELLSVQAMKAAMQDAGIDRSQIDGLITCKSVQGLNTDVSVGPLFGINPPYAQTLTMAPEAFRFTWRFKPSSLVWRRR
jgi:acetyl-CoA acetyltransferase